MKPTSNRASAITRWLLLAAALFAEVCLASSPPRLLVANPGESPIVLRRLAITAEITGSVALTTVEMEFYNPNRRQLEGELQFPLLDGQQITGFALDIDGRLRDAVPIEKTRGQQVFEDITRQRVDPGLLQATQGNNFKLRVYPIFAQRSRTVAVTYSESLAARGMRGIYRLPLEYGTAASEFSLAVAVRGSSSRPIASGSEAQGLTLTGDAQGHELKVVRRDHAPRGALEVAVDLPPGQRTLVQAHDGRDYFHAELPVGTRKARRELPRTVGIVWDSSLSGAARDHARELALLDVYFSRLRDGEVHLTRIRNVAEPVEKFTVTGGNWHALRRALETTVYDGATDLGAFRTDAAAGEYLMFSDGLDTFGDGTLPSPRVPLYAISSSAQAHPAWLKHVAQRSGGRYIDLLLDSPRTAAAKILTSYERIRSIQAEGAEQVIAVSPWPVDGNVVVTGVLAEPSATLKVELGLPGRPSRVVSMRVSNRAPRSALAASFWARARVAELEPEYAVNRAAILSLGRSFRIVTRETSLIVLETVQDYVRFDVEPPRELAAEYERIRRASGIARAPDPQQKIERVVAMLNEKESWWRRDFRKEGKLGQGDLRIGLRDDKDLSQDRSAAASRSNMRQFPAAPAPVDEALRAPAGPPAGQQRQSFPDEAFRAQAAPSSERAPHASRNEALPAQSAAGVMAGRAEKKSDMLQGADTPAARTERSKHAELSSKPADLKIAEPEAGARPILSKDFRIGEGYAVRLRHLPAQEVYRAYLDERPGYASSPAFFVDAAEMLYARGQPALALRVLSNLAELDLENRQTLRTLGHRLMEAGEARLAVIVFRRVLELSPEEPQSFRDLGLAYAAAGDQQRAVDTLYEVVLRPWHDRFPGIELIALADLNSIAARRPSGLDLRRVDPRLLRNLPLDVRVVLTWDADNTDVNLAVADPLGQTLHPGGGVGRQGARMSYNYTGGYGPEEYSLRQAKSGKYQFTAHFASHRQQVVGGGSTYAHLRVYTKFGTAEQTERSYSVQLPRAGASVRIAEIDVPSLREDD